MITCFVFFNTYTLLEAEIIIILDLLLQILLHHLKIFITFTHRRQEAPDSLHLVTRQRGQFRHTDTTVDVMCVSLCDWSRRSKEDCTCQLFTANCLLTSRSLRLGLLCIFLSVSSCICIMYSCSSGLIGGLLILKTFFLAFFFLRKNTQNATKNTTIFSFKCSCNSISTSSFVKLVALFQIGCLIPLAKPLCVVFAYPF